MQNCQLERVLNLARRTGDKIIFLDDHSDSAMVVMNLDQYENLLQAGRPIEEMNEKEMLEKINRDIAIWRVFNNENEAEVFEDVEELSEETAPTSEPAVVAPVAPAESAPANPDDEEKFYLEPVE